MLAQIDRVVTDLLNQSAVFKRLNPNTITVAFVGVNHADEYVGHEGERQFVAKKPPRTQAPEIMRRLDRDVRSHYDEFLFLRFKATNKPPFPFSWIDGEDIREEYASMLVRISDAYERRF